MMTIRRLVSTTTLALFSTLLMNVQAQTPPIEVTTDNARAQFSTQGPALAMHVEVFCPSGELVFEHDSAAGQAVEWQMVNDKGERVADGLYLATITVTDLSGKRRKRIEQIIVNSETRPKEVLSTNASITVQD
jgi:hypothetical protein